MSRSGAFSRLLCAVAFGFLFFGPFLSQAEDLILLTPIEVKSSRLRLLGVADSASEGVADARQIRDRVSFRPGEALETIPGLIVSQHSGEGKANQYFLRGFNLDHGTDLKITLDGMPVNQRSHAHGQGWADLNPLIPELISSVDYRKGPYSAADGDFANAGSAAIHTFERLESGIGVLGMGQLGYGRMLFAASPVVGEGNLLYALELTKYDGPWVQPDRLQKLNGILRYSRGSRSNGFHLTAMGYSARWTSTDQLPWNEYQEGKIGRFDSLDKTDGATSSRYSVSGEWRRSDSSGRWLAQGYVIRNELDLYSNFEYSPESQFNQRDRRITSGLHLARTWDGMGLGKDSTNTVGLQAQNDNVFNSLGSTTARAPNATCQIPGGGCRADHVNETSLALYAENRTTWNDWFRSVLGLRGDGFRFDNRGISDASNTASIDQFLASPKGSAIFGPWDRTEVYYSLGNGYHSNDARGVTIGTGTRADGLVRAFGQEVGIRSEAIEGLESTLSLFQLDNDSEIVYIGDEGRTEDSGRRSRRLGLEFNHFWKANRWLSVDADFAYSRARFRDPDPAGEFIPGAVEGVASISTVVDPGGPWSGALQFRYFGPRPLTEDNVLRSHPTATLNARCRYRVHSKASLELSIFNLLDTEASAIEYATDSYHFNGALVSGNGPYRVFHPMEPRNLRLQFVLNW